MGVYSIERKSKTESTIYHRFKNMSVVVPVSAAEVYTLDYNHSETKAVIQDSTTAQPMVCTTFFPPSGIQRVKPGSLMPAAGAKHEARVKDEQTHDDEAGAESEPAKGGKAKAAAASGATGRRKTGPGPKEPPSAAQAKNLALAPKRKASGNSIQAALKIKRAKTT